MVGFASLLAVAAAAAPSAGISAPAAAELVAVAGFTSRPMSLNGFVSAGSPLNALLLNFESALSLLDPSSVSVLTALAVSFVLVLSASVLVAVASVSFAFEVVDTEWNGWVDGHYCCCVNAWKMWVLAATEHTGC